MSQQLKPVDLKTLRDLMDHDDEAFLRKHLPRAAFFRLKRLRIRVTWKYVRRIADNSAMAMQVATTLRQCSDGEAAQAARELAEMAWQVNAQCLIAFARLTVEYLFPAIRVRVPLRPLDR